MGAQGSKRISRKLPQNIVSNVESSAFETHSANKETIIRELRNKVTEDDGKDPHLLKNLFIIGQVNVPKEKEPFKQSDEMLKILRNRKADKEIEGETPRNRIFVYELREMLEQRKKAPNEFTAEKLSTHYNLDTSTIETLLKHINTFTLTGGVKSRAAWVEDSRLFRKNEN
ncbi:unnamed protein product [Rhizophagus irregularis]|uniref:Uncharacterized protein n=2 Tax=Rhizophagus irregularis TaxID=588596 RepID=A0A915ZIT7_9GLOM|nr:hypothetical protein RirG_039220 [Rhizophagus irregularis DAOM 197198w]CAB4390225.1 unnamed protein product [Rhizophagus irregularis]GET60160.1 hypothetical protein RIR_jg17592.t2 [Rhizophagus irregularis DAOM 181602=DAOM 197198]CAB4420936.1 unnamed protein product [Rhizophagus irregularis]CAB4421520.1 unnamed protein product [Rhizophagus irregularis]